MEKLNTLSDYYTNAINSSNDGMVTILEMFFYDLQILLTIYYNIESSNYLIECCVNVSSAMSFGYGEGITLSADASNYMAWLLSECKYNTQGRMLILPDGCQTFRLDNKQYDEYCKILEHMQENNWTLPVFEEAISMSAFSAGLK